MNAGRMKTGRAGREGYWREHVDSWRASGLSQASYAQEAGIHHKALGYWKRKFERARSMARSHPRVVPVPADLLPGHGAAEVPETSRGEVFRLRMGPYSLEIPPDFAAPALVRLLECLERRQ